MSKNKYFEKFAAGMDEGTRRQWEIYRRMTPQQKLEIALRLNRMARELKAAWLRQLHSNWPEQQVQAKVREIFLYARS
ncbi:MAG: hypothetical protein JW709_03985 [Sedimentisphaerales bacterium]|nr:hypothetical protein [Sedimentisphaerales bacterium]